jgi:predicted AAA+ superfamily ATPase
MMYLTRHLENKVIHLGEKFKVVLVLGARQVGKTTLLRHLFKNIKYFVFDPVQDLYQARQDPDMFLQSSPTPVILDEVQYVPEILASLKRLVDESSQKGQYYLTGSQNFAALRQISESLAGRVVIVELNPLTIYERSGMSDTQSWLKTYLKSPADLMSSHFTVLDNSLLESLWQGGFPATLELTPPDYYDFFHSYLQTYVERDIRNLTNIRDLTQFSRFVSLQSALTGQEINNAHLGREIGISPSTAQDWLSLLINSYQLVTVPAFSGNLVKRISRKSKTYFTDTGFACHLMRINSYEGLLGHPAFGALFETFCVNQILRLLKACGQAFNIYHWRTGHGSEVDLILEMDGIYYPIEFKAKTNPSKRDARGITQFRQDYAHLTIAPGLIIHGGNTFYKLETDLYAIPWNAICL